MSKAARVVALAVVGVFVALAVSACTPKQIGASYFRDAPNGTKIAECIIQRESGGNPGAISATNDYGLFQINRAAHKRQFESMFGGPFEKKALDPTLNAKYARYLYDWYVARGYSGWTPWKGGQYRCF